MTSGIWDGFQFIGTRYEGAILSSPDGLAWVRTNRIVNEQDGLVWNEVDSPEPLLGQVTDIAWHGTRFEASPNAQTNPWALMVPDR